MRIANKWIKLPPVTTSTDAMDTEEGDAITKMILDKTKVKARRMQRRSRLIKGWDMELDDVPRPLSIPLPDYANEGRAVERLTTDVNVNTNLYSALGGTRSSYQLRFTIAAAKANHHSVSHQYEREPPSPRSTPWGAYRSASHFVQYT